MLSEEERKKLEDSILASDIPEDTGYGKNPVLSNVSSTIKKNPGKSLYAITIVIVVIIIIGLLIAIISMLNTPQNSYMQQSTMTMNGFDALITKQEQELSTPKQPSEDSDSTGEVKTDVETSLNPYFVSPAIESASPYDSLIQIGEQVYKLPVSLKEFEQHDISLVTLGSQPPSENVKLSAGQRNGYIQFNDERYIVTLKNGIECNYHDLTVIGITIKDIDRANVYAFGGLAIGSEEAAIPVQTADSMGTDAPANTHTYYYYGSFTETTSLTKSGKRTAIVTDNTTGKIDQIDIFDDGTVTGNDSKKES